MSHKHLDTLTYTQIQFQSKNSYIYTQKTLTSTQKHLLKLRNKDIHPDTSKNSHTK